jgi:hypothetical protein
VFARYAQVHRKSDLSFSPDGWSLYPSAVRTRFGHVDAAQKEDRRHCVEAHFKFLILNMISQQPSAFRQAASPPPGMSPESREHPS